MEGNAGTTSAGFTVSLSAASGLPVTVGWSTAGIVAVEGEDYASGSGIVTFDPGDVDKPISIDVYGDTRFEPDETFRVVLANPTGATIADGTGVGTIRNDDVDASADVSIVKFADHDLAANPVPPGQRLVYTLVVTNVGPADGHGRADQRCPPAPLDAGRRPVVRGGRAGHDLRHEDG